MSEKRDCLRCKGTGKEKNYWYGRADMGELGKNEFEPCRYACDGSGQYESPDFEKLKLLIKGRKGIKSSRPYLHKDKRVKIASDRILQDRAYYVWRMVRFHAGIDTTLPVMASCDIRHDPFKSELDQFVDLMAVKYEGTHLAGAYRWGRAMGMI
jgi:hypothetical protein